MESAIYEGTVYHRRLAERAHEFRYRVAMPYLDLDEVNDGAIDARLTRDGPGILRFRRRDYLGDPKVPLTAAVRALVAERLGAAPQGPVRLLTQLSSFGYCFNPVSFYYCFGSDGTGLEAIVAEVTNTPWGERHAYVLPCLADIAGPDELSGHFDKALHVSPFMCMDQHYAWRATVPGERLSISIGNLERGERVFTVSLCLRRRPLDRRTLAGMTLRYPLATQRSLLLIYAQGVVLKLKGVRVRRHP